MEGFGVIVWLTDTVVTFVSTLGFKSKHTVANSKSFYVENHGHFHTYH